MICRDFGQIWSQKMELIGRMFFLKLQTTNQKSSWSLRKKHSSNVCIIILVCWQVDIVSMYGGKHMIYVIITIFHIHHPTHHQLCSYRTSRPAVATRRRRSTLLIGQPFYWFVVARQRSLLWLVHGPWFWLVRPAARASDWSTSTAIPLVLDPPSSPQSTLWLVVDPCTVLMIGPETAGSERLPAGSERLFISPRGKCPA